MSGLPPLVPKEAPAFLRRFILSEVLGPPLGRLPTGARAQSPKPAANPVPDAPETSGVPRPSERP
jgi:hypothetical protein